MRKMIRRFVNEIIVNGYLTRKRRGKEEPFINRLGKMILETDI